MPKKGIAKISIKKPPFKSEDPHFRLDYNKKNKKNKNSRTLFAGFIVLIGGFGYIILGGFI
jgi:hypothetical protein